MQISRIINNKNGSSDSSNNGGSTSDSSNSQRSNSDGEFDKPDSTGFTSPNDENGSGSEKTGGDNSSGESHSKNDGILTDTHSPCLTRTAIDASKTQESGISTSDTSDPPRNSPNEFSSGATSKANAESYMKSNVRDGKFIHHPSSSPTATMHHSHPYSTHKQSRSASSTVSTQSQAHRLRRLKENREELGMMMDDDSDEMMSNAHATEVGSGIGHSSVPSLRSGTSRSSTDTTNAPPFPPVNQSVPDSKSFRARIIQQPKRARICGFGEKDRRTIDPTPIVQLEIYENGALVKEPDDLHFYIGHASLLNEKGEDVTVASSDNVRMLMGSLVSSIYTMQNLENEMGHYFLFPDLSIRIEGIYRLKFTITKIGFFTNTSAGTEMPIIATVISEPLQAYTAKKFPGMSESSDLTKTFSKQGAKLLIRKDTSRSPGIRTQNPFEAMSEDDDEE